MPGGALHQDFFKWLGLILGVANMPMNTGKLLENVTLTVGVENRVAHGLGVQFRTWYVADLKGAAIIYRNTASTADLTLYLPLLTTDTVTCDIVVVPA